MSVLKIFDFMRLADTASLIPAIVPQFILDWQHGKPEAGSTIAEIESLNKEYRLKKKDIFDESNIGDRSDWYSDATFSQQQFTGVNPTTIALAPPDWIEQFKNAAKAQSNKVMLDLLQSVEASSLYMQDCSYFRKAINVTPDAMMKSDDGTRFACAAVSLFHLSSTGKLILWPLLSIIREAWKIR